jgi:cell division GTPase FtsZ
MLTIMRQSPVHIIGFGSEVVSNLIGRGLEMEQCTAIGGNTGYLRSFPAPTRIALEPPDNLAEKYCYHEDDPAWGNRMILRQGEIIKQRCSGSSMIIITVSASSIGNALVGAATMAARLLRGQARIIMSIIEKPFLFGNTVMLKGTDALINEPDMTVMFSLEQFKKCLPLSQTILGIVEKAYETISAIILDLVDGVISDTERNIPLDAFRSNGIGYTGTGKGSSVEQAMEQALISPTIEHSALDRAKKVLAYFLIHRETDMTDVCRTLKDLQDRVGPDVGIFSHV